MMMSQTGMAKHKVEGVPSKYQLEDKGYSAMNIYPGRFPKQEISVPCVLAVQLLSVSVI